MNPTIAAIIAEYALPELVELVKLLVDEIQHKATALQEARATKEGIDAATGAAIDAKFGPSGG